MTTKDPRESETSLGETNRAAIFEEHGGPEKYEIKDLPAPRVEELKPGEVVVRNLYSGVCHSDYSALTGSWPMPTKLPLVGGHEGAGVVVALGPGADEWVKIGDRVGIKWIANCCLKCDYCMAEHDASCSEMVASGYVVDGTFQKYTRHAARYLTKIPDELPLDAAASILCAGVTIYRAIKEANVRPGQWLVVPGSGGGLGHLGIQYARYAGLRVIGIDTGEDKKKLSLDLGAEAFIDFQTCPDVAAEIKKLTGGLGAHAATVAAASGKAYEMALTYIRPRGTLVVVGMPNVTIPLSIFMTVALVHHIVGSAVGSRRDALEALDIAARGHVKVVYSLRGLSELPAVFEEMKSGKISGRVVLDVDK